MSAQINAMSCGLNSRSAALLLALCAGSATAFSALGQSWLNAVDGNWSDGTKWSGGTVPNSAGATATLGLGAPYTVALNTSFTVGNLAISNPAATLQILNNQGLFVGAATPFDASTNDGTIFVNPAGISQFTSIYLNASHVFTGSGRITLNASGSNIDTARFVRNAADPVLTNAAGHTINGTGQFNDISIANAGLIDASVAGAPLQIYLRATANTGTLRASAGTLQFNGSTINQSGAGQVLATGTGVVSFYNMALNGGSINSSGGGQLLLPVSTGSTFDGVVISSPLTIYNNSLLAVESNGLTINAPLTVNPDGISQFTSLRINPDGPVTLGGNSSIILNSSAQNIDTARFVRNQTNSAIVLGPNLTVRGTGQFNDIAVTNNGAINADVTDRALQLYLRTTTNNNLMTATNGGSLNLNGHTVNNSATGRIVADGTGSLVNYINSAINGGNVVAQSGGVSQLPVSVASTFDSVTISGPFNILNNSFLAVGAGGIVVNGVVTVNPLGISQFTSLRADADNTPITGTGVIALNCSDSNIDTARFVRNTASSSFVLGSGITVRGTGQFNDIGVTNNGVVNADLPGKAIQIYARTTTNNNLLTATNGGVLQPNSHTINNVGNGRVVADGAGSITNFINSAVNGGNVIAQNGGVSQVAVSTGSTFNGVTISGPFNILNNSLLAVAANGIVVNGTLTVNSPGVSNFTSLRADDDNIPITGTGTIVLNTSPSNIDTARFIRNTATASFVLGSGITVRGTGQFNDIAVTNNGIVNADVPDRALQFNGRTITNNNLLTATNGGVLQPFNHTIVNVGNGRIVADGLGSITNFYNAGVSGGSIIAQNNGESRVNASAGLTLDGVTVSGPFNIFNNSVLTVTANGIVNNGIITINSPGISNFTSLQANADNTPITGTGTIVLNASPSNIDTGRFTRATSTASFLLGPGQTLAGFGNLNDIAVEAQGTIAPGAPAAMSFGLIQLGGRALTLTPTSIYRAQIGGTPASGLYDRITGTGAFTLNGTLIVTVDATYVPTRGDRFDIILAGPRTGRFTTVQLPSSPNGVWKYAYLPNGVRVGFACNSADPAGLGGTLGPDGGFTPDDLIVFLDGFFGGDLAIADVAGLGGSVGPDGLLTVDDIIVFLSAFFAGCQQP
ncbi:MAG: beta strand repeat-containing protein [Phycisphaerales bacterium]